MGLRMPRVMGLSCQVDGRNDDGEIKKKADEGRIFQRFVVKEDAGVRTSMMVVIHWLKISGARA